MKPLPVLLALLFLAGCATPEMSSVSGSYSSAARAEASSRVIYRLTLERSGSFAASHSRYVNGVRLMDSSLHVGGYDPHEMLHGTWNLIGDGLVLHSGDKQYKARMERSHDDWQILWDGIEYQRTTNPESSVSAQPETGPLLNKPAGK